MQAGDVNTGAFDPLPEVISWARERGAWVHVDGAFGLWALADPARDHLTAGISDADSWATDGHKWLNVTYDCGIVLVRRPGDLLRSFGSSAGYLPSGDGFEAMHYSPQASQRARQVEVWAALRTLGREASPSWSTAPADTRRRSRPASVIPDWRCSTRWCSTRFS